MFVWRAMIDCGELAGWFQLILSYQTCSWDMVSLTGMSLYRDAITGSQELGREFNRIVLKFLSVMSAPRAFAWESLLHIIVMWFGKSSPSEKVKFRSSCSIFCLAMSDVVS